MSAIASPTPGISVRRPSSTSTWSGTASAARLSAARRGRPSPDMDFRRAAQPAARTHVTRLRPKGCRRRALRPTPGGGHALLPRRSRSFAAGVVRLQRLLQLLRCPNIIAMMEIGAVCRLLRQEVIDSPDNSLEVPDPSERHRSSLAKGSDGVGPKGLFSS
jgi:hypothetical protein